MLFKKLNRTAVALDKIKLCIEKTKDLKKGDRICSCLLVPQVINNRLEIKEVMEDVDLLKVARKALKTLEFLSDNNS